MDLGLTCQSAAAILSKRDEQSTPRAAVVAVSSIGELYRALRDAVPSFSMFSLGLRTFVQATAELAWTKMSMYDHVMAISVTQFRASCLELIRRVETGGEAIDIKRRGKVVARLAPPPLAAEAPRKPWEQLRGSGELLAEPGESVLHEREFQASR